MNRLASAAAVALGVLCVVSPAFAGILYQPVPEPTTLSLVSGGVALAIVGARWFRRK